MDNFNATRLVTAVVKATSEGVGVVNSSAHPPRIPWPGDNPTLFMLVALLVWRGVHQSLMAARAAHETASLWVRLFGFAWNGIQAIFTSFFNIFTKTFWEDIWTDTRQTLSPMSSSCGICLNAYSCGLICNPGDDDILPIAKKGDVVVAQSPMTLSKTSDLQRPPLTVVVERI